MPRPVRGIHLAVLVAVGQGAELLLEAAAEPGGHQVQQAVEHVDLRPAAGRRCAGSPGARTRSGGWRSTGRRTRAPRSWFVSAKRSDCRAGSWPGGATCGKGPRGATTAAATAAPARRRRRPAGWSGARCARALSCRRSSVVYGNSAWSGDAAPGGQAAGAGDEHPVVGIAGHRHQERRHGVDAGDLVRSARRRSRPARLPPGRLPGARWRITDPHLDGGRGVREVEQRRHWTLEDRRRRFLPGRIGAQCTSNGVSQRRPRFPMLARRTAPSGYTFLVLLAASCGQSMTPTAAGRPERTARARCRCHGHVGRRRAGGRSGVTPDTGTAPMARCRRRPGGRARVRPIPTASCVHQRRRRAKVGFRMGSPVSARAVTAATVRAGRRSLRCASRSMPTSFLNTVRQGRKDMPPFDDAAASEARLRSDFAALQGTAAADPAGAARSRLRSGLSRVAAIDGRGPRRPHRPGAGRLPQAGSQGRVRRLLSAWLPLMPVASLSSRRARTASVSPSPRARRGRRRHRCCPGSRP